MDCNIVRYWVNLFIDGQLEEQNKVKMLEHISDCAECEYYFNKCLEVDNCTKELFREKELDSGKIKANIMDNVKEENLYPKKRSTKKKTTMWASIAAVLLLVILTNNTVMAYINKWVKSLTIRKPGIRISVENGDTKETKFHSSEVWIPSKSETKTFYTLEDLNKDVYEVEKKPVLPNYLPDGFKFDRAFYEKFIDDPTSDFNITSCFKKKNEKLKQMEYIETQIQYNKKGVFTSASKKYVYDNEEVAAVKVNEEDGILTRKENEDGFKIYNLEIIYNKYGAKVKVRYTGYGEDETMEKEIINIAKSLVDQIKEEVPENKVKPVNGSNIIESINEEELYNKIMNMDDRIVKLGYIPSGYKFKEGGFIENPKEIKAFSCSSDFFSKYTKDEASLVVCMNYFTHTNKDSDFDTYWLGEFERGELLGYDMAVFKDREIEDGSIERTVSVSLRDYATTINVHSRGLKDEILSQNEIEKIVLNIIENIKKQAVKRETIDFGRHIKVYGNIYELRNSQEIKERGFAIPTYIPKEYKFLNGKYIDDGYLLELGGEKDKSICIRMVDQDMLDGTIDGEVYNIEEVNVSGYNGHVIKGKDWYSDARDEIKLELELPKMNFTIEICQTTYTGETMSESEIIKIAESMIEQLK